MSGRRFGKTIVALIKAITMAGMGTPVWYMAPTYRQAKLIAWRKLISLLPREVIKRKNESELFVELKNGHLIELKGCDNEEGLKGSPIFFGIFDETCYIKPHVLDEIILPATIDYNAPLWFLGTPSRGKDWFYKLYKQGQNPREPDWASYRYTTLDNPYLSQDFIRKIKSRMSVATWNQECLAIPGSAKGLVHPGFNRDLHVVSPFPIPSEWIKVRGMDWGVANPTCFLWAAIDPKNFDVYIYREHYQNGWTVKQHANKVKAMSSDEVYKFDCGDPSIWKRERDGKSVGYDFNKEGIRILGADNNITRGLDVVNRYLTQKPKVFIFDTMVDTLDEMETYMYLDSRNEKNINEKPEKKKDHAMNALRYLLVEVERRIRKPNVGMSEAELRLAIDKQYRDLLRLPLRRKSSNGLAFNPESGYVS